MATGSYGKGSGQTPLIPEITFPGSDIYTAWSLGPGRQDFFPSSQQQTWIPVLLSLKSISARAFASGRNERGEDLLDEGGVVRWRRVVRVSTLFLREEEEPRETLFLSAFVKEAFFLEFLKEDENQNLRAVVEGTTVGTPPTAAPLAQPLLDEIGEGDLESLDWPDLSKNERSDGLVIIGIIDDGIPFGHERFWKGYCDTRVEYVWLQDAEFNNGVDFQGRELTRTQINDTLAKATHGGLVDEDAFYRHADIGAVNFGLSTHKSVARQLSHGGHVMDAAAGYDYRDSGQRALAVCSPIIAVQLPTDSTADTSGWRLEPNLYAAMRYIWHRANLIAARLGKKPIPVVINFSYGHHLGAHDGSFLSERAIESLIAERENVDCAPLRVVVPSGNSHLSRTHAQIGFDGRENAELLWRVQPGDRTWSFMEIWLPKGFPAASRLAVEIASPGGDVTTPLDEVVDDFVLLPTAVSSVDELRCILFYRFDTAADRGVFLAMLPPTERLGPKGANGPITPSGLWSVKLIDKGLPEGADIHAWISRDGPPLGFPAFGRQSYFDHGCYQRYDDYGRPIEIDDPACEIRRDGTISGLATSDGELIAVGGYLRKEVRASPYSSGGPTSGTRFGPDVMAVSDDSMVHRGLLAAGTRSGSVAALDGTSVAAPQITRWVAGELLAGRTGDRTAVQGAATVPFGTPERTGRGGVDQGDIVGIPVVDLPRYQP